MMKRLLLATSILLLFTHVAIAQDNREILRLGRGTANALDWRPDGEVLAVGSGTGVWLYDADFETLAHLEDEDTGNVQSVKWSPEGDRIASANDTGTLQIWNVADDYHGEVALSLNEVGTSVAWSPDGEGVAVNKWDSTVSIFDAATGEESLEVAEVEYSEWIKTGLAWSPDGHYLAVGAYQNIRIWDTVAKGQVQTIHDERLRGDIIEWSLDGAYLSMLCSQITDEMDMVVSFDLCEWDFSTGEQTDSFELGSSMFLFIRDAIWSYDRSHFAFVIQGRGFGRLGDPIGIVLDEQPPVYIGSGYAVAWRATSNVLTVADVQGILRSYDATTGDILVERTPHTPMLTSIAWNPAGNRIAATGFGYEFPVNIWDIEANNSSDTPLLTFYPEIVDTVQWKPDGNDLVTFGNNRGETAILYDVLEWDSSTGERLDVLFSFYSQFETLPIVAWNSDFTRSAYSSRDDKVEFPREVFVTVSGDIVEEVIWSPDDSIIGTISRDVDSDVPIIETWDVETGNRIGSLEYHAQFYQLIWSPNSDSFAVLGIHMGQHGTYFVEVYDAQANLTDFELVIEDSLLPALAWNNDGDLIAIYAGRGVNIYEVQSGDMVLTIPAYRIHTLSWHPDDTLLAGGSADGTIRIWDVSDLAQSVTR